MLSATMTELVFDGSLAGWRRMARAALIRGDTPESVWWTPASSSQRELGFPTELVLEETPPTRDAGPRIHVPRGFLTLADQVACHRDDTRWGLLYRTLWRLTHGEPHLLDVAMDPDVHELNAMAKAVRRDIHKMRAFVRFRTVTTDEGEYFVAWFEPAHHIVEANAPFFCDRFPNMRWSILTPDRSVHWNQRELKFSAGVSRSAAPTEDAMEDLWRTYYASIFNPARVKIGAMTKEMPRSYWRNLPEAALIPGLIAGANARRDEMVAGSDALQIGRDEFSRPMIPETPDIAVLRTAAAACQACPLWRNATCTVFGDGPTRTRLVFVGEQPGDQEDRQGKPFVGPAGQLLNRALIAAGIERSEVYLTNAVKHFKWEPRGKRRLHQRPNAREVAACRPWLEAELRALRPERIVCLGATAAQSVLGRPVRVLTERGEMFPTEFGAPALVTIHPSALLRLPAEADADAEFARFAADLQRVGG
jgi:probable DNA metabolism protein